jgi:hypothetical protein
LLIKVTNHDYHQKPLYNQWICIFRLFLRPGERERNPDPGSKQRKQSRPDLYPENGENRIDSALLPRKENPEGLLYLFYRYATKSLRDFVFALSKEILEELKPSGKKALQLFWKSVKSLHTSVSFDINGTPSLSLGLGDIQAPATTLDEIFHYLNHADKPCLVAIDEFQQIAGYAEDNVEATLRTYVQHCSNAHFIFAGSQRHIMGNMFLTPSRPFYQSVSMMHLESIPLAKYTAFAQLHFAQAGKSITDETVETIYRRFDGITWYMQKVLHTLYDMTPAQGTCEVKMVEEAIRQIIDSFKFTYSEILFRIPEKQKELLIAITKEGKAKAITSAAFIKKYKLSSSSSVQSALKGLLEKDFITQELGIYQIYDQFLGIWLKENY